MGGGGGREAGGARRLQAVGRPHRPARRRGRHAGAWPAPSSRCGRPWRRSRGPHRWGGAPDWGELRAAAAATAAAASAALGPGPDTKLELELALEPELELELDASAQARRALRWRRVSARARSAGELLALA